MLPRCRTGLYAAMCLLLAVAGLVACGSDDDDRGADAGAVEKAFLTAMVPHHEAAIEMAKLAGQRADDPLVANLADDIASSQAREIAEMRRIYRRLFDNELRPDARAHERLGLSAEEAGMSHSPRMIEALRSADPFDRAFVDEMVPHHKGAVRMSEALLKSTRDAALRRLAERIISAQEHETEAMNDFRTKRFGGPVPAGAGHGAESTPKDEHPAGHAG